jgi:hypothetical protein
LKSVLFKLLENATRIDADEQSLREPKQSEERWGSASRVRRERGTKDRGDEIDAGYHYAELDRGNRCRCGRRWRRRVSDRLTDLAGCTVRVQCGIGHVRHADRLADHERIKTDDDADAPSSELFA